MIPIIAMRIPGHATPKDINLRCSRLARSVQALMTYNTTALATAAKTLPYLKNLRIMARRMTNNQLKFVAGFVNLTTLHLGNQELITSVEPIAKLTHLRQFCLIGPLWRNPEPLGRILTLEHVVISRSRVSSLEPLVPLRKLTSLSLDSCMHIEDYRPLTNFVMLSALNLSTTRITSLRSICELSKLRILNIRSCVLLRNFLPLAQFDLLESLDAGRTWIESMEPLRRLRHLANLNVSYCTQLYDIRALFEMKSLQIVNLISADHHFRSEVREFRRDSKATFLT
jgi:Leucine-rich repeat (LRR) protein